MKRKRLEDNDRMEDSVEANFKIKDYYREGLKADVRRAFSLPIKTDSGLSFKAHDKYTEEAPEAGEEEKQSKKPAKQAKTSRLSRA